MVNVAVAGVITVPCGEFGTDSQPYPPRALPRAPSSATATTTTPRLRFAWRGIRLPGPSLCRTRAACLAAAFVREFAGASRQTAVGARPAPVICTSSATVGWAFALQVQATPGGNRGLLAELQGNSTNRPVSDARHGSCIAEGPNPWDERSPSRPRPAHAVIISPCLVCGQQDTTGGLKCQHRGCAFLA